MAETTPESTNGGRDGQGDDGTEDQNLADQSAGAEGALVVGENFDGQEYVDAPAGAANPRTPATDPTTDSPVLADASGGGANGGDVLGGTSDSGGTADPSASTVEPGTGIVASAPTIENAGSVALGLASRNNKKDPNADQGAPTHEGVYPGQRKKQGNAAVARGLASTGSKSARGQKSRRRRAAAPTRVMGIEACQKYGAVSDECQLAVSTLQQQQARAREKRAKLIRMNSPILVGTQNSTQGSL